MNHPLVPACATMLLAIACPQPQPLSSLPTLLLQNFLYEHGLQNKPIVAMGISAGASFAVKVGTRLPCC